MADNRNRNNTNNQDDQMKNREELAADFDLNVEDINRTEEKDRELNRLRNRADNDC